MAVPVAVWARMTTVSSIRTTSASSSSINEVLVNRAQAVSLCDVSNYAVAAVAAVATVACQTMARQPSVPSNTPGETKENTIDLIVSDCEMLRMALGGIESWHVVSCGVRWVSPTCVGPLTPLLDTFSSEAAGAQQWLCA